MKTKQAFLPDGFNHPKKVEHQKNSDTLVLHPKDASTDFLSPIYAGKGYDVLNSFQGNLSEILPEYKRIIMMGHGWTQGLFSVGKLFSATPGFAVSDHDVPALKGKDNCYIWCMASDFVSAHGLKGFSTGMFISEVEEAGWFHMIVDQEEVDHSNHLFAQIMSKQIDHPNLQQILKEYDGDSPMIQYNRKLLKRF